MSRLQSKGRPNYIASRDNAALKRAASDTLRLTDDLLKATDRSKSAHFADIIQKGGSFLLESLSRWSDRRLEYKLDFNKASDAFLNIATNTETLLMDLLLEEEKDLHALGQEEILSSEMGRMTLASVLN
jgi:hypothetical protein